MSIESGQPWREEASASTRHIARREHACRRADVNGDVDEHEQFKVV